MNPLAQAISIAAEAHQNQVDKAGAPYISHPLRLMAQMSTDEERMTAVLHDVVEDSEWTFEQLSSKGIPDRVIEALRCVTKKSHDEDYSDFIRRAAANPIALRVKIADLEDNMNLLRLKVLHDRDVARLRKYHAHWRWLLTSGARSNPPNVYRSYPLTQEDRTKLLALFPPRYSRVIADHISAESLSTMYLVQEGPAEGEVIGFVDAGGLQSLIVRVNGRELTGDGSPFHSSWSSDPTVIKAGTGAVVREFGYTRLEHPIPIDLSAGPTHSAPLRDRER